MKKWNYGFDFPHCHLVLTLDIVSQQELVIQEFDKNHSYLYRLAGNLYNSGESYKEIKYVTQINFNNCKCPVEDDIGILIYEFINLEYNLKIEGIKSYEIYLDKYKNICEKNYGL